MCAEREVNDVLMISPETAISVAAVQKDRVLHKPCFRYI